MSKDMSILNPINPESINDSPTQDSVESSTVNPTDSTTDTHVEVDSAKTTSTTKSKASKADAKTTNPKPKPVSPSFFTNRAKEVKETKRHYFNDTDYIDYNTKFSKLKKDDLIIELINTIEYCKKNKIKYLQDEGDIYQYTYYLIIKYFTSLYPTLSKWSVEKNIEYLKGLYDRGDFEWFFDEIFPHDEVEQVMEMLRLTKETATLYAKDIALRNKQIDEQIQSPILKDKLKNEMIN